MKFENLQNAISYYASANPAKTAIECGSERVTYQQLEQYSSQIANFFNTQPVGNKNILILLEKSPDLIGTILGILNYGGVFVPLDVKYPENRVRMMVEEVQSEWIVLKRASLPKLEAIMESAGRKINVLVLDGAAEENCPHLRVVPFDPTLPGEFVPGQENQNKHCYIYFTSGSTGQPKGVQGRHKSLLQFIEWEAKEFTVTSDFRVSNLTSPSFDPYLRDIFLPLFAGATICIPESEEIILVASKLKKWILEERISLIHMTPALFKSLSAELDSPIFTDLQYIILAGEKLRGNDVKKFISLFGSRVQLVNMYGPTETTLAKMFYRVKPGDEQKANIPVGKPIDRAEALILDEDKKRCRTETIGEVYIRTPYISSGYYNRPELTREVFMRNPFTDNPQDIIYKTGDLGILLPDGNIELVGRVDHQIKIRGMRVEPGEIENQLLGYEAVKEAVIVAKEDTDGDKFLCAYVVLHQPVPIFDLKAYLTKKLPEHMVPTFFTVLEKMPLSPNGKIDRGALPDVDRRAHLEKTYTPPTGETESRLVEVWSDVLGVSQIGIDDDFFALGGHSLKAAMLVSKVFREFETELPIREIFLSPTVRGLAQYIRAKAKSIYTSIEKIAQQEFYPLSSAQKRQFILNQIENNTSYNLPKVLLVEGPFDRGRLHSAVQALVQRHESLRTSFVLKDGEPVQIVHAEMESKIDYYTADESEVNEIIANFIRPFDLQIAPLLRVGLITCGQKHFLMFDLHHIIADGSSLVVLINDFLKLYNGEELPELSIQYKDFAAWQNALFASPELTRQEEYWLQTFAGEIPVLNLMTDFPRGREMSFTGETIRFSLGKAVSEKLRALSVENGATLYMTLLAILHVLLHKYTGQEDIIIGSPIAGRRHVDLEKIIGMFVNTLAMRNYPAGEKSFNQFLHEVKEGAFAAYENQDYQFEMLVENLHLERDLSRNPLFDVMFILQNTGDVAMQIADLHFTPYDFANQTSKFDLSINAFETEDGLLFSFAYCTQLFRPETITRLTQHFVKVMEEVVANPNALLAEIEILTLPEKEQVLYGFNSRESLPAVKETIYQLFEEQVEKTPDALAVSFAVSPFAQAEKEKTTLTYRELNHRANHLASVLRAKGAKPNTIVGIVLERSLELAVAVLAVLKSGAAYLPIDPGYPEERIAYMVADSGVAIVVSAKELHTELARTLKSQEINEINHCDSSLCTAQGEDCLYPNILPVNHPTDLAYVIYTSGSTGTPKGVMIEHQSILNTITWRKAEYNLTVKDRVLQLFSFAFDGFITSFFTPIVSGAEVVFLSEEGAKDPAAIKNAILTKGISHFICVPPLFAAILDCLTPREAASLKTVVLAGDKVNSQLVQKAAELNCDLEMVNEYGPTENSVATTVKRGLKETITIGQPIPGTSVYILDKDLKPLPIGVLGELCISGAGLARGYLHRPELSAEKFITNPYISGTRLYRTGDMARWLANGEIEFYGRSDEQVKIRGFRIETGEIENALMSHPEVEDAVVVAKKDAADQAYLSAYIVTKSEVANLKEYLLHRLPEYMVPAFITKLASLPITPNGKVDKKALPEITFAVKQSYTAPQSAEEEKLAQIWAAVLQKDRIGREDNFFELGGDSIKAIQIVARASQQALSISVKDIFKHKTLAAILANSEQNITVPTAQGEVTGEVPLTPIQHWFFTQNLPHPEYFNQTNLFTLPHDVDLTLLEGALQKLVEHHDALRMCYTRTETAPGVFAVCQVNRGIKEVQFTLEKVDLSALTPAEQKLKLKEFSRAKQENLNLAKDLLFRGVVFDLGEAGKRFLLTAHHLIIDGVSWRILLLDLVQLYQARLQMSLSRKTTSYQEWAKKLTDFQQNELIDTAYWEKIDLSKIQSLANGKTWSGSLQDYHSQQVSLTEVVTEKLLSQIHRAYSTEITDILLAALSLAAKEAMHLDNLLITLEGHGREEIVDRVDLTRTVGWFTAAYPLYLEKQPTLSETIKYVKESLRKIPAKGLNYGLARYGQKNAHLSKLSPEIGFNYLGQFDDLFAGESLFGPANEELASSSHPRNKLSTLIDINGAVVGKKLQLSIRYNQAILDAAIIEKFGEAFLDNLTELIAHCAKAEKVYTPSDFNLQQLITVKDFGDLQARLNPSPEELPRLKFYELTPMQEGMLFHNIYDLNSRNYYEQIAFYLEGNIQLPNLQKAWEEVLNRHESFRTSFHWERLSRPLQVIWPASRGEIICEDLTHLADSEVPAYLARFKAADLANQFDFSAGKLTRLSLCKLGSDRYFLIWTFHHILLDGWSGPLVLREFLSLYQALCSGQPLPPNAKAQFSDYLEWLRLQKKGRALQYWGKYLQDYTTPAWLIPDKKLNTEQSPNKPAKVERVLEAAEIREFCQKSNITVNTLIETAWGILLQKYTNSSLSAFGMTVSGRPTDLKGVEGIVGLFINTLPVIVKSEGKTVGQLLSEVNQELVEMREYEHISLAEIQKTSAINGQLFDTIVVFENYPVESLEREPALDFSFKLDSIFEATNYHLALVVKEGEKLNLKLFYNEGVFSSESIERLSLHLLKVIHELITATDVKAAELELITAEERRLLAEFNATNREYPAKTIHQLFAEQVAKTPNKPAVAAKGISWTYRELNDKANSIAQYLCKQGLRREEIVGVLVDQSLEMFSGILGVLKAGGAYLPLDPNYPAERLEYMLSDSQARILLTLPHLADKVSFAGEKQFLNSLASAAADQKELSTPDSLAYVIYTSGSTGKPKGVMVEHHSLVNLAYWHNQTYEVTAKDNASKYAGFSFDASVWEIFPYLITGAAIHLVPEEVRLDVKGLHEFFLQNQISISFLPTQMCEEYLEYADSSLRYLLTGGDKLKRYKPVNYQLVNNYGPTENTVVTTYYPVNAADSNIPIGKPVANVQVYILDKNLQLLPPGIPGELWITGASLARGYLHQPELTAEKFVANPFNLSQKMYRTGDLARWRSDGNIEFLGRIDNQVKIRGYRVELGEIESLLLTHPLITAAAIIDRTDLTGSKYLDAYVVSSAAIEDKELKAYLAKELPDYMLPLHIIHLNELPLTPNGKLDRKALPLPEGFEAHFVIPKTSTEQKLANLWKEILGVGAVSLTDNFFELGGHSLKATQLAGRVLKEFGLELPLKVIFSSQTLGEMSAYLQNISPEKIAYQQIKPAKEMDYYPVSSAQRRLYALQMLELESTAYNIPGVTVITGDLQKDAFASALQTLVDRHEALRTSFSVINGEIVQKVQDVSLTFHYLEAVETDIPGLAKNFVKPFDLSQAPLFRVSLVKCGEKHILMFDMHHIISDGTSMALLIEEVGRLYAGEKLPEVSIQYKDFALWQNDFMQSEALQKQESYWLETFKGEIPVLNLPTDFPRPQIMTYGGSRVSFHLAAETTQRLQTLTKETNTTLYMLLLAAYNAFLFRYTAEEDIIIGSPIAGRRLAEVEKTVGMFVNTLAMRNQPVGRKTFLGFLQEVKENSLQAFENQDYQFEMLLERLALERDLSRNPLFDTMFALQNVTSRESTISELSIAPYPFTNEVSKFDLTLNAEESGDKLKFTFEYRTDLFKAQTVERMANHFMQILQAVAANPAVTLASLEMLSASEKWEVLTQFNATWTDYPRKKVIHQLFEEQVWKTLDNIAVVYENEHLTYSELNRRANILARVLREKGVVPDQLTAIMVHGSLEMMVGIMAVLKAGGAYIPIDPVYPDERIAYMLNDSRAQILLTQPEHAKRVDFAGEIIDLTAEELLHGNGTNLDNVNNPRHLAYAIYTSGSTGKPKGVLVEHRSLVNLTYWHQRHSRLQSTDRSTKYAGFSFDASILEIFPYLTVGAAIHIIPEEWKLDLDRLNTYFHENGITTAFLPTPICEQFVQKENHSLRQLLTGGDKFKHYTPVPYPLIDNYGPAENTVTTTVFTIESQSENIPIGKPIDNVQIYLVNNYGTIQPVGVYGELCVGGEGLARGYLNNPELTAQRFVPNPFNPGKRMYRTGDLARWLPDGNLEFLGRTDTQVKIRGNRIELGEIETQLMQDPQIKAAVVIVRTDLKGNKYLAAYYVTHGELTPGDLKARLAKVLPDYMVPAFFICLDQIPLTPNGKVDRRALPEPEVELVQEYTAPTNEVETKLAAIWADITGRERVGIQDNFFELGGDSVKAIQIQARAIQVGINISVKDIFKYRTIASILSNVDYQQQRLVISQEEVTGEVPLTPVQHWFFSQKLDYKHYWNQSNLFALPPEVDLPLLEKALQKLITHHDALRMAYMETTDKVQQYNRSVAEGEFKLEQIDLASLPAEVQQNLLKELSGEFQEKLNLAKDLLIKAVVFDLGENGKRLFITIHHLIIDGISWRILLEDLELLYNSRCEASLPLKTTSFKEWSEKLAHYAASEHIEIGYWTKIDRDKVASLAKHYDEYFPDIFMEQEVEEQVAASLSEEITVGELFTPGNYLRDFARISIDFSAAETENLLTKIHSAYNTEINDILLTALTYAVDDVFNLENVLITLEGHGREELLKDVDITRTIGWFTAAYPVYLEKEAELSSTIKSIKENLRRIPGRGLNYGIASYLGNNAGLQELKPEISFNYLGQFDGILKTHGLLAPASEEISPSIHPDNEHQTVLDLIGMVVTGELHLAINYNPIYFPPKLIGEFKTAYHKRLLEIIEHCLSQTKEAHTASDFAAENLLSNDDFDLLADIYDL